VSCPTHAAVDGFVVLLAHACLGPGSLREPRLHALRCSGILLPGSVMALVPPLSRYALDRRWSRQPCQIEMMSCET
jgi:hypothetical protein